VETLNTLAIIALWTAHHAPGMPALKHPLFGCPCFFACRPCNLLLPAARLPIAPKLAARAPTPGRRIMHFTKHIKDEHTEFGNDSFLQFYYRENASMVYYGLLIMSLACQPCFSFHNTIAHTRLAHSIKAMDCSLCSWYASFCNSIQCNPC
jgi:hypothetical protein